MDVLTSSTSSVSHVSAEFSLLFIVVAKRVMHGMPLHVTTTTINESNAEALYRFAIANQLLPVIATVVLVFPWGAHFHPGN